MNRLKGGVTLAVLALACALVAASAGSAGNRIQPAADAGTFTPAWTPLGVSGAQTTVMLQLAGDPVTVADANAGGTLSDADRAALQKQLKGSQDAIKGAIAKAGGRVLGDYQLAYNGIKVRIAANKQSQLEGLPGVLAVRPLQLMKPNNERGVPFIGAPAVWDGLAGLHGEGIKIGIIDTGIDYTHANFGGPGTIGAFDAADAVDTVAPPATLMGALAPRVKGGVDLVGDDYNADPDSADYQPIPHPDPNPLDCNGHGSHVAGTAAGNGVLSNGSTYNGPYNASTVSSHTWTIGPGVAPKADLYGIRVFGCEGSTDVTVDAIEWAVKNHLDVINMSLGSPFGSKDDPSAVASTNAAKDGVIVVTSTGNSGPSQYIAGSPGNADGAISTAANDSWVATPGVLVQTAPGGLALNAINANAYHYTGPISGSLVVLKDNPATTTDQAGFIGSANEALGCSPSAYTFNGAAGKIAVAQRGTCARVAKAIYGQQGGASAVLMTNNAAGLPPFEGPITVNADTGEPFVVTIPFVGIAGNQASATSDSGKLLASPAGSTVTLSEIPLPNTNYKGFASFSSGGPRPGDSALKPDVTAPGVSIQSTAVGTGNGGTIISGTSMASPHNAGAAALVLQAHPKWKVEDIKSAIVNTADPSQATSTLTPFRISRGGAGEIQPAKAVATQVVASANGGSKFDVAVSFGLEQLKDDFKKDGHIKLRNFGSSPATFTVAQAMPQGSPHAIALEKTSITVPAKGDKDLNFTLTVPAATAGGADAFQEVAGFITFTPAAGSNNGVALRVPYYLVPRPQADVETTLSDKLAVGKTVTATVANKAEAPVAGDGDFYAWGLEDKKDKGKVSNDVRAIGIQSFAFPSASVATRRLLVFAVNVHDPWSNAATNEFDIYLDVNGDGVDDYIVVGADQGAVQTGTSNGLVGAFVFSTRSAGATLSFAPSLNTDGSTVLLPVLSTSFCRTGEPCLNSATVPGGRIAYHAVSFDLLNGGADEVDGLAKYNPWHEAITTGGFAGGVAPGTSDSSNDVAIDAAEWALTPAKGLMVVTMDNKNGKDEAQLIKVGEKK